MAKQRKMISLDESVLSRIDKAAEAAGENRSQFLTRASIMCIEQTHAVTPGQYKAIRELIAEFDKDPG